MRQLLIVKAPTSFASAASPIDNGLTNHGVKDISTLKEGAITFFELGEDTAKYNAMPKKNFAIALGRANGQLPFMIPEVDVKTLHITKAIPMVGNQFLVKFTMPTTVIGKEYTLRFFKKGTVPHERNSWTVSIVAKTTTAGTEATAFKAAMDAKVSDKFQFTTSIQDSTEITMTGSNFEDWEVIAVDSLSGETLTKVSAKKPIGDKTMIAELASFCAAGKGFRDTDYQGREYLPGYPEKVEDFTLNTSGANSTSTSGYVLYTLRFKVGRDSGKQRDERVWQNVYIACPIDSNNVYNQITNLDKILPEGDYANSIAKAIADAEVNTLVNSAYLA